MTYTVYYEDDLGFILPSLATPNEAEATARAEEIGGWVEAH